MLPVCCANKKVLCMQLLVWLLVLYIGIYGSRCLGPGECLHSFIHLRSISPNMASMRQGTKKISMGTGPENSNRNCCYMQQRPLKIAAQLYNTQPYDKSNNSWQVQNCCYCCYNQGHCSAPSMGSASRGPSVFCEGRSPTRSRRPGKQNLKCTVYLYSYSRCWQSIYNSLGPASGPTNLSDLIRKQTYYGTLNTPTPTPNNDNRRLVTLTGNASKKSTLTIRRKGIHSKEHASNRQHITLTYSNLIVASHRTSYKIVRQVFASFSC